MHLIDSDAIKITGIGPILIQIDTRLDEALNVAHTTYMYFNYKYVQVPTDTLISTIVHK